MMVSNGSLTKLRPKLKRRHQRAASGERYEPYRKQPCTEEKMSARLSNFHLSDHQIDSSSNNWFFMQKPQMTFEEIEDRLTVSSGDEDDPFDTEFEEAAEKKRSSSKSSEPIIEFADDFKDYFDTLKEIAKTQKGAHFSPCTEIVLWRPKEDILLPSAWDEENEKTGTSALNKENLNDNNLAAFRQFCRQEGPVTIYNVNGLKIEEILEENSDKLDAPFADDEFWIETPLGSEIPNSSGSEIPNSSGSEKVSKSFLRDAEEMDLN